MIWFCVFQFVIGCNMLSLLLLLSALGSEENAVKALEQQPVIKSIQSPLLIRYQNGARSVADCPITYCGKTYTNIYIRVEDTYMLTLDLNFGDPTSDIIMFRSYAHLIYRKELNITALPEMLLARHSIDTGLVKCTVGLDFKDLTIYFANIDGHSFMFLSCTDKVYFSAVDFGLAKDEDKQNVWDMSTWDPIYPLYNLSACGLHDGTLKVSPVNATWDKHKCAQQRVCDFKGGCTCHIFGPFVVDESSKIRQIRDLCAYVLLDEADMQLLATFRDRRYNYIPMIDSLQLSVKADTFDILQGGVIKINRKIVELNENVTELRPDTHFSKTPQGIKIEVNIAGRTLTIKFDSDMVRLDMNNFESNEGLCLDKNLDDIVLETFRRMEHSKPKCRSDSPFKRIEHISCHRTFPLCDSVPEETELGRIINTICNQFLCVYQHEEIINSFSVFLQNLKLLDAGSDFGPSRCVYYSCAEHEFCGLLNGKQPVCNCRQSFAKEYRSKKMYGLETVCTNGTASVEVFACLVEEKGFNVSTLHLQDPECKGQYIKEKNSYVFSFNQTHLCDANVTMKDGKAIYRNAIMNKKEGEITREATVFMVFSCLYDKLANNSLTFEIEDKFVMQHFKMGMYECTVKHRACKDSICKEELKAGKSMKLGKTMWIQMKAEDLDTNKMSLVMEDCWISDQEDGKGRRYDLVINECPNLEDGTVSIFENGVGNMVLFSYTTFQFVPYNGVQHMHCRMQLCLKEQGDCEKDCKELHPGTHIVGRRSVSAGGPKLVSSISWTQKLQDDYYYYY